MLLLLPWLAHVGAGGVTDKWRNRPRSYPTRCCPPLLMLIVLLQSKWLEPAGVAAGNVEGIDDSILFKMRWKDPLETVDPPPLAYQDYDMVRMISSEKEPYVCFVPRRLQTKANDANSREYDGPTPLELLEPLMANRVCRYKLDHYWTYQLCHGKSLRQYHEDTTTSKVQIVEFYLGKYDLDMMKADNERYKAEYAATVKSPALSRIPSVKLDGVDHPYFAVNMSYGTLCDITHRPRTTQVWYVCDHLSDHEMHSFEEPSSCTYRVVVRTPLLCKHPDYRVEVAPENEISCHPTRLTPNEGQAAADCANRTPTVSAGEKSTSGCPSSKSEPQQQQQQQQENQHQGRPGQPSCQVQDGKGFCEAKGPPGDSDKPSQSASGSVPGGNEPRRLREMIRENEHFRESAQRESDGENLEYDVKRTLKIFLLPHEDEVPRPEAPPSHDHRHIEQFLNGDFCLQGGTGWWKYEFCYGKRVSQFHVEKGERTQEILLGRWNQQKHRSWVDANPMRKTMKNANHLVHFYSGGDICEVTGRPRTVEVKLVCKSIKDHPDAVSIFLQEPKPCEYKLTVESSIICSVLESVDEYGLPANETPVDSHYRRRPVTPPSHVHRQGFHDERERRNNPEQQQQQQQQQKQQQYERRGTLHLHGNPVAGDDESRKDDKKADSSSNDNVSNNHDDDRYGSERRGPATSASSAAPGETNAQERHRHSSAQAKSTSPAPEHDKRRKGSPPSPA